MKILFIQNNLFTYFGIMPLSGFLKKNNHASSVIIDSEIGEKGLIRKISDFDPDIIGFSVMSTEHAWLAARTRCIKDKFPRKPIIVGGIHAICYPEKIIPIPAVDYVCYGEGELTLAQILSHIELGSPIDRVGGIFYKKDGKIFRKELNDLVEIESFEEDRTIYYKDYKILRDTPLKNFSSSRGCPFKCSFCANTLMQKRFAGKGPYVRRKPADRFISELENVRNNYGMKSIYIADDLFISDKKWLKEFSALYKERVNTPFICTCRADMLDDDTIRLLAAAGCHTVTFGVESGNEEIRREVLKKYISNKQFLECAGMLRKAGIRFQTSNMFCLPGETVADAVKTIDLNIEMKTSFTMSSIFLPLPGTELADFCINNGLLKADYSFQDMPSSFVTHSVLKLEEREALERLQKVAALIIQYPKLRGILIWTAKFVPIYHFHFILYLIGTVLRFRSERKLTLFEAMGYIWSYRKSV